MSEVLLGIQRLLMAGQVRRTPDHPLAPGVKDHEIGRLVLINVNVTDLIDNIVRFATVSDRRQAEKGALTQRGLRLRSQGT